jgi:hypothetical protein
MKTITIKQARFLLDINEPIILNVGNEFIEITRDNLLTTDEMGNKKYFKFDRPTIKELVRQLMGIDTLSWKYIATERGELLLY